MIRVLDSTLKIISTITRYTSVEFEKNFNDYGTFTVQLPKASGNTNLKKNNIINHKRNYGIIKYISETDSEIIIKGFDLKYILAQRVAQGSKSGKAETVIKGYISDTIKGNRSIDKFSSAENAARGETVSHTIDGAELLSDTVAAICETQDWGYDVAVTDGAMVFDICVPKTVNYVYSKRKNNIKSCEYTLDALGEKNVIYNTDSEGNTSNVYSETKTGLERVEAVATESGTTDEIKAAALKTIRDSVSETLDAEILRPDDYGTVWNIGDYVSIKHFISGGEITVTKQITAVTEVYEASAHRVTPTFGKVKESIFRKIIRGRA